MRDKFIRILCDSCLVLIDCFMPVSEYEDYKKTHVKDLCDRCYNIENGGEDWRKIMRNK